MSEIVFTNIGEEYLLLLNNKSTVFNFVCKSLKLKKYVKNKVNTLYKL